MKENFITLSPKETRAIKMIGKPQRQVCGFKENALGEVVVTTGIPRELKPGVITYGQQRNVSYEQHMYENFQQECKKRR